MTPSAISEFAPAGMPLGTPIEASEEELAAVKYDRDGLVVAIVQEASSRDVLMVAWMDAEALRRTLATGRTWCWSRSRQRVLVQGRDLRRPAIRPRGRIRLRRRRAPARRRPGGSRGVSHGGALVLLPGLRRQRPGVPGVLNWAPESGTGSSPPSRTSRRWRPSTAWCRSGGSSWPTPSHRSARSARSSATAPVSCSSAWSTGSGGAGSRFSGARPSRRSSPRPTKSTSTGDLPLAVPLDSGILACARGVGLAAAVAQVRGAAARFTAARRATSATTSCGRSSASGRPRLTTSAFPTR